MLIGSGSKRSPPQANSNRWISVKFAPLVTQTESLPSASVKMGPFWEGEQHGHRRSVQAEAAATATAAAKAAGTTTRPP